nr:biopolymer transporter ExbD [Allomuricauda sp.]
MSRNREIPEVNAGSMADIAFLLLIFFLVTTAIETDMGLLRKLPSKEQETPIVEINERNVFRVNLNKRNQLLVEEAILNITDLKAATISFLDNGGVLTDCSYCEGLRLATSSDSPKEAIITFSSDREASYGNYIQVQNELTAAYNELRNRESLRLYGVEYLKMVKTYSSAKVSLEEKLILEERINRIRQLYPLRISEAETTFKS